MNQRRLLPGKADDWEVPLHSSEKAEHNLRQNEENLNAETEICKL